MNKSFLIIFSILILAPLASAAADVVYILEDGASTSLPITSKLNELGLTYEVVRDSQIVSTDFDNYQIAVVHDVDRADLIPFTEISSIFFDREVAEEVWPLISTTQTTRRTVKATDLTSFVFDGVDVDLATNEVIVYVPFFGSDMETLTLSGSAGITTVALSTNSNPRPIISYKSNVNNGETVKNFYFGASDTAEWNSEGQKIFENAMIWLAQELDADEDGWKVSEDCDDNDDEVYPGAEEIPYDGIDQDCSGFDFLDVDNDGFCEQGSIIESSTQCSLESGNFGTDCDDNDDFINLNNPDLALNCVNDAPQIISVNYLSSYSEGDEIVLEITAQDPEEDSLEYSADAGNFDSFENNLIWEADYLSAGSYNFNVSVYDGFYSDDFEVSFTISNVIVAPVYNESAATEIIWNEDTSKIMNLNDYFYDADGGTINFGVDSSELEMINYVQIDEDTIELTGEENFFGEEMIRFYAENSQGRTNSEEITLSVSPVNDAPEISVEIEDVIIDEDSVNMDYLNLNDYFVDVDSEMEFSVLGDDHIDVFVDNEGSVSFVPEEDFSGSEEITFLANDGEFSVESNEIIIQVFNLGETPFIEELNCDEEILEDENSTCEIVATDFEGNEITLEITDSDGMDCEISGDNLVYSGSQNYFGEGSCEITASDIHGSFSRVLEVEIEPVNDAAFLNQSIGIIQVDEDDNPSRIIDLNDYFVDVDSDLEFGVAPSGTLIPVIVEVDSRGYVGVESAENFFGEFNVTFVAADEEFSVYSNSVMIQILPVNDAPVLGEFNCNVNITEDTDYNCTLNATDLENSNLTFSVGEMDGMDCEISGDNLVYSGSQNYFGEGSCEIIVSDGQDEDSELLEVSVNNVNDAPEISTFTPALEVVSVVENTAKIFTINAEDSDSDFSVKWIMDGIVLETDEENGSFTLNKPNGVYLLEAEVTDGELSTHHFWTVIYGPVEDFTCSEIGGNICPDSQVCSGSFLGVKDTNACCSSTCIPTFRGADSCNILSENVTLEITRINSNDDILLGEEIRVEFKLDSEVEDNYDLNVHLYNTDEEKSEEEVESDTSLEAGRSRILRLNLPIPADLDLEDEYVVFVKANGEECNQAYKQISINRPDDMIIVKEAEFISDAICPDRISGKVVLENLGSDNQDVKITIQNKKLKIDEEMNVKIEQNGEEDRVVQEFEFELPANVESGEYTLAGKINYASKNEQFSQTFDIQCVKPEVREGIVSTVANKILLNSAQKSEKEKSVSKTNSYAMIAVILMLNVMLLASVGLLYAANKKKAQKRN